MRILKHTVDGRNPANHLGCRKPCEYLDKLPINWSRVSSINSMASHKESIGFCPNIGHGGEFSPTNTFESFGPPVTTPQIPRNHAFQEASLVVENPFLGGGFKYFLEFSPQTLGKIPMLTVETTN